MEPHKCAVWKKAFSFHVHSLQTTVFLPHKKIAFQLCTNCVEKSSQLDEQTGQTVNSQKSITWHWLTKWWIPLEHVSTNGVHILEIVQSFVIIPEGSIIIDNNGLDSWTLETETDGWDCHNCQLWAWSLPLSTKGILLVGLVTCIQWTETTKWTNAGHWPKHRPFMDLCWVTFKWTSRSSAQMSKRHATLLVEKQTKRMFQVLVETEESGGEWQVWL